VARARRYLAAAATVRSARAGAPPVGARTRVWSRIERQLAPRQPRNPLLRLVAPALSLGAAVILIIGAALHTRPGGALLPISWSTTTPIAFDLHGAARVVLGADTRATLLRDDAGGIVFELARGSLLADVAHRPEGAPFRVSAPTAGVRVVGTVLWVAAAGDGATTVEVGRGAVEVQPTAAADARAVIVHAGERWPAETLLAPDAADLSLLGGGVDVSAFGVAALSAEALAPPTGAPATKPARRLVLPAARALAPRPATGLCPGLSGSAAIACLEKVAASGGALRAESALYEIGRRRLRDLDQPRAALAAWERQRSRFPSGALRPEADLSIVEALVRLDERARARREIDAYLATWPDGLATPELRYLAGVLDGEAGDCARAIPELEAALRAPAEPWATAARDELRACRDEQSDSRTSPTE
jgi:hypothetical protein